ncbi:tyrosine-type recombinase/integrase [Rhodobacteraceae bacterium]|nr:tyrosine-type recombinase/integrase [Paracoccaceae bacterium]
MRRNFRAGIRLKYLNKSGVWPSGNVRWYLRKPGEKAKPMPDLPIEHPDFLAAYVSAQDGKRSAPIIQHASGTLGWALRTYLSSEEFINLAPATKEQRRRIYIKIEEAYGRAQVSQILPKHIRTDLAQFTAYPANNRLKCWRPLMAWLVDRGVIDTDPAKQVARRKVPKSDGHLAWSRMDLEKFRAHWPHDTRQRLCMELLYRTCASVVDACAISRKNVSDGWLTYRRSKSGSTAMVPWAAANAPAWFEWTNDLENCISAQPADITYIVTAHGKPRSHKAVSSWFSNACTEAGLDAKKSAHGLRKLRAAMFRENGATKDQRMAILGHESEAEAEHYDKSADLRRVLLGQK